MQSISMSGTKGFSLLEMMVAIAVLALSLGALYQAVSGATRNVRSDERYAYGVELAQSVLANNSAVPASGVNASGETEGGFFWSAVSQPVSLEGVSEEKVSLHHIMVTVRWRDGRKSREVVLDSIVERLRQ